MSRSTPKLHLAPASRALRLGVVSLLLAAVVAVAGCGGSEDASTLLKQTFSGPHTVNSGNLSFSLTANPSGSTTLTGPISLSFGGPFQSRGTGKLPESNFNLSFSSQGRGGTLGILSTGNAGYVTLQGATYQLPAATFQKLESSFSSVTSSGGGSHTSALSRLGINPLNWLTHPQVVGKESVGGTGTTHIRAGINLSAFLADLSTLLQKASASGVSGSTALSNGLPATTQEQIASSVQNPTFDVWTGTSDKTLRRMSLALTVPVTGQVSTALGGLRTARVALNMQYANLNQPQSISAPSTVRPFAEFAPQLRTFLTSLESSATGGGTAGGTGSGSLPNVGQGSSGSGSAGGASSANLKAYTACLQAAGQDVSKMQSCASLLNNK